MITEEDIAEIVEKEKRRYGTTLADQIAHELNPTHVTATVVQKPDGVVVEWEP